MTVHIMLTCCAKIAVCSCTIVNGFCDEEITYEPPGNGQFGEYKWPETTVGQTEQLLCDYGPSNTYTSRVCVSRGEWGPCINCTNCYTYITMLYQTFDVVDIYTILIFIEYVKCLTLQDGLFEGNIVERIDNFSRLVQITTEPIDQSQKNFVVIVKVFNATRNIVNRADFNDTTLGKVELAVTL